MRVSSVQRFFFLAGLLFVLGLTGVRSITPLPAKLASDDPAGILHKSDTDAYATFFALNAGPSRTETIKKGDTYATIAKRVGRTEGCLRSMNPKSSTTAYPAKVLVVGKSVNVPLDTTCVPIRYPDDTFDLDVGAAAFEFHHE